MANALLGDEPRETDDPIRKLYGEGRAEENQPDPATEVPVERDSAMQHVAGSVLRRGRAQADQYDAELVVIAIERDPNPRAVLEGLPDPKYGFGVATTSDDAETVALALHAIAARLERST